MGGGRRGGRRLGPTALPVEAQHAAPHQHRRTDPGHRRPRSRDRRPRRPDRSGAARRAGLRAADRRQAHRRDRRHSPLRLRRKARARRGPGSDPDQLRPNGPPPPRSRRQPPDQRRHPPHRAHPRPHAPRKPGLHRARALRRQDQARSHARPQALHHPPHLAAASQPRRTARHRPHHSLVDIGATKRK